MNILVATDGALEPDTVVETMQRVYRDGDNVMVFTAVNLPRDLLRRLGAHGVEEAARIAHEAGATLSAGDRSAERLRATAPAPSGPNSDPTLVSALAATAHGRTKPIVDALKAEGIPSKGLWLSSEYRTAKTILTSARAHDADLIIIGSHGTGGHEGALGSTGTKLVRQAKANVLVLRTPTG